MKINDIKYNIFAELEPFAVSNGFKAVKSQFALTRNYNNRTDKIYFTTNSWGFEIHLFPYVSVDFNEVTTICNACGFHLNHSAFINLRLLQEIKLHGFNPDLRWQMQVKNTDRFVLTDNDLDYNEFYKKLSPLLPLALDFISKNNSVNEIDRLFNTIQIERYSPYCSGLDTHCMIGIITAKISQNSNYEKIKQMYLRVVKYEDLTEEMKASFARVITYLEQL